MLLSAKLKTRFENFPRGNRSFYICWVKITQTLKDIFLYKQLYYKLTLKWKMFRSGATAFNQLTFIVTTFSVLGSTVSLSINAIYHNTQHTSMECRYAECCNYLNIMLDVVMLNVVMLSVVVPFWHLGSYSQHFIFSITYNWPNNLECYITLSWKGFPRTNTLAYWASCKLWRKWKVMTPEI